MRYNDNEMETLNEYEALQEREAELLDLVDVMHLSLAERNALEYSMEFVQEEMGSLRCEYHHILSGRGH
jgi:hypothetical protein